MAKQQSELHGNMQRTAEMSVPLGYKICRKCGIQKDVVEFSKCSANPDGIQRRCRECQRLSKAKWDEANAQHRADYKLAYNLEHRDEARKYTAEYRKNNYEKVKEYDRQRKKTDKFKEYLSNYHAKHYIANKTHIVGKINEYQKNNPDKIRQYKKKNKALRRVVTENTINDFTLIQWIECKVKFDHKCAYCGRETELEQEHVVPVTKGGMYTKNNIVPSCRACNGSKTNKHMEKWFKNQPYFSKERLEKILIYISQR